MEFAEAVAKAKREQIGDVPHLPTVLWTVLMKQHLGCKKTRFTRASILYQMTGLISPDKIDSVLQDLVQLGKIRRMSDTSKVEYHLVFAEEQEVSA